VAAAPVRFAVLGVDHIHAFSMAQSLARAGGELAAFHGGALAEPFARAFPAARAARGAREILEDAGIALVLIAAVPDARARLAVDAMRAGKDVLVDKPGAVTLDQLVELSRVQRETARHWAVYFSERIENPATVKAVALARAGAIGRPLHVESLGPHRLGLVPRPDWFWDRARSGGILADLASHAVDQFLCVTGATKADVVAAVVANHGQPERTAFEDFGELLLRTDAATGYARVDWYTPQGLPTWGDLRLFVVGSEGTLEVRKNLDVAGREGASHLFVVDTAGARHLDCVAEPLPFAAAFLRDVAERTQTALPSEHCVQASEIALRAQALALRLLPPAAS
jgi:predicted dehydrogenase